MHIPTGASQTVELLRFEDARHEIFMSTDETLFPYWEKVFAFLERIELLENNLISVSKKINIFLCMYRGAWQATVHRVAKSP